MGKKCWGFAAIGLALSGSAAYGWLGVVNKASCSADGAALKVAQSDPTCLVKPSRSQETNYFPPFNKIGCNGVSGGFDAIREQCPGKVAEASKAWDEAYDDYFDNGGYKEMGIAGGSTAAGLLAAAIGIFCGCKRSKCNQPKTDAARPLLATAADTADAADANAVDAAPAPATNRV